MNHHGTTISDATEISIEQTQEEITPVEVCGSGCKCTFCRDCALAKGLTVRGKLYKELATWRAIMMLTFTIDPKQFLGYEEADKHVKKRRAISRTVHRLFKEGHLFSRRFFSVFECQKSGNPHWHVLVEASYVPHDRLTAAWNAHGPNGVLGYASFSKGQNKKRLQFESSEHAANYACKYLLKQPEEGWPDWVLDCKHRIRRHSSSRGLFGMSHRKAKPVTTEAEASEAGENSETEEVKKVTYKKNNRTIRQRMSACKSTTVVLLKTVTQAGTTVKRFAKRINKSWGQVLDFLGGEKEARRMNLTREQTQLLFQWGNA